VHLSADRQGVREPGLHRRGLVPGRAGGRPRGGDLRHRFRRAGRAARRTTDAGINSFRSPGNLSGSPDHYSCPRLRSNATGEPSMAPSPGARRIRRLAGIGGLAALVTAGLVVTVTNAEAATAFSDNFESSSISGWSKSGGTWSLVADGSQTLRQS